jgi:hypothetical protein
VFRPTFALLKSRAASTYSGGTRNWIVMPASMSFAGITIRTRSSSQNIGSHPRGPIVPITTMHYRYLGSHIRWHGPIQRASAKPVRTIPPIGLSRCRRLGVHPLRHGRMYRQSIRIKALKGFVGQEVSCEPRKRNAIRGADVSEITERVIRGRCTESRARPTIWTPDQALTTGFGRRRNITGGASMRVEAIGKAIDGGNSDRPQMGQFSKRELNLFDSALPRSAHFHAASTPVINVN